MRPVRTRRSSPLSSTLIALLVTACAFTPDSPSPTDPHGVTTTTTIPTPTTTVTLEEGLENYRECVTEQGVSMGEIELDGLGRPRMAAAMEDLDFTDREVLEALDSCSPELTTGALDLGPDPVLRDMVQTGLKELADCIRREGVAGYPDPVAGFNGLGSPFPMSRIPWTDPDLADAVAVCSERLGASST